MAAIRKPVGVFVDAYQRSSEPLRVRGHGPLPLPSSHPFSALEFQGSARVGGFTLIELVVVVAIIAVLATAVTLSVDAVGATRQLEREARRFEALAALACERAEASGRDIGVHVATASYGFSTFLPTGWRLEPAGELRERTLPKGFQMQLEREGAAIALADELTEEPQLVCFASGELTPFALELERAGARDVARYAVRGEGDGSLEWRAVEPGT